jgi:hypothetical protein
LLPVCGTGLILAFAREGTAAAKFLSLKPLVGMGLISYSAYLWHQPLFAFARIAMVTDADSGVFLLLAVVSIILAYFTWRYVETPFRERRRFTRIQIFALAGIGSTLVLSLGAVGSATDGGDFRYSPMQKAVIASYSDAEPLYSLYYRENKCFLSTSGRAPVFASECYGQIIGRDHASVLWGDSHAASLHTGLFAQLGAVPKAQLTSAGCPPLLNFEMAGEPNCVAVNDAAFRLISQSVAPRVFLAASCYTYYKRPHFAQALARTIQALHKAGAQVILVGTLPQWRPSLPDLAASKMTGGGLESVPQMLETGILGQLRSADAVVSSVAEGNGARFISMLDALCKGAECRAIVTVHGVPHLVAWDYGHLTLEGSQFDAGVLMQRLTESNPPAGEGQSGGSPPLALSSTHAAGQPITGQPQ